MDDFLAMKDSNLGGTFGETNIDEVLDFGSSYFSENPLQE